MNKIILYVLVISVVVGGGLFAWQKAYGPVGPTPEPTPTPEPLPYADLIHITAPVANALITSPLTVSGEARGTWYFEASFPVAVLDANHNELVAVPAQAQGEWMTENFVPFMGTLEFTAPATDTGFIVFKKDNPSGLPEHDASVEIPVRFR